MYRFALPVQVPYWKLRVRGDVMIIECPSCLTRYDTPAPQIPKEGRNVRCAKCSHVWLVKLDDMSPELEREGIEPEAAASPEPETGGETGAEATAAEAADVEEAADAEERAAAEDAGPGPDRLAEDAAMETGEDEDSGEAEAEAADQDWLGSDDIDWGEDDEEPAAAVEPVEEPEPEPEPEPDLQSAAGEDREAEETEPVDEDEDDLEAGVPPHAIPEEGAAQGPDRRVLAGWAGLALFVVLTATLVVTQRVAIVRALPGAASLYRTVGLPVNVRGLDFDKVTSTWTVEAGRSILEIHGDIVNVTDDRITVPTVVFALRNSKGLEVYQWAAEVRNEPLGGGERTPFVARIPTPPKSIQSVQVKFAKSP